MDHQAQARTWGHRCLLYLIRLNSHALGRLDVPNQFKSVRHHSLARTGVDHLDNDVARLACNKTLGRQVKPKFKSSRLNRLG